MVKKVLLLSSVLFGLLLFEMAGECFADTSGQLEQAKTNAISLIKSGDDAAAQTAIAKLTADFSADPDLPKALYSIARMYTWLGKFDKAGGIYQDIITDYPGADCVSKAQMDALWINALSSIDSGNNSQAQAAVAQLTADFSGDPGLSEVLYCIAKKYAWLGRYYQAKTIYQDVMTNYPGTGYALESRMDILWMGILSSIELGNIAAARADVDKLTADFSGNPRLPEALYHIARRYSWAADKHEEAKSIYQNIITNYPGTGHASESQMDIVWVDVITSMESGNDTAAQAAIDRLTADFSGNPRLPESLYHIAKAYGWYGKYKEAKGIYQQIIQQYPDSSHVWQAQLDASVMDFWGFIRSGNDSRVQAAIAQLTSDFSGNPDLPDALSRTAEQYYIKGSQLEKEGLTGKSRDYFQKAAAIWEAVVNEHPGFFETAKVCCWAGDCYRKLGEYEKSITYYQKVADDYPGYNMAWNALFMVGRSYENLKESGVLSTSEADSRTRAAYEQLLARYPDCKAARIASRWLSRHNSK